MIKKYSSPTELDWTKSKSGHRFIIFDNTAHIIENNSTDNIISVDFEDPLKDFANLSNDVFLLNVLDFAQKYGLLTHKHSLSSLFNVAYEKHSHNPKRRSTHINGHGLDPLFPYYATPATDRNSFLTVTDEDKISLGDQNALSSSWVEPLSIWHTEHGQINAALYVWDMIANRKHDALKRMIKWHGDCYRYAFPSPHDKRPKPYPILSGSLWAPEGIFRPNDNLSAAMFAMREIVDKKLQQFPYTSRLMYDALGRTHTLIRQTAPLDLLGLLWFEVSQVVTGKRFLRLCSKCRKWEEMAGHKKDWTAHKDCNDKANKYSSRDKLDDDIIKTYEIYGSIDETVKAVNAIKHTEKPITSRKVTYALKKMKKSD